MKVQDMIELGGKEWIKGSEHRIYFDDPSKLIDLEVSRYGTGSIKSAYLKGEKISNNVAHKLIDKIYFDVKRDSFIGRSDIIALINI